MTAGSSARAAWSGARSALKRYFWLWIAYQTVKGLATTTLIWLPLLYVLVSR